MIYVSVTFKDGTTETSEWPEEYDAGDVLDTLLDIHQRHPIQSFTAIHIAPLPPYDGTQVTG